MPRNRQPSRIDRWNEAAGNARSALEQLQAALSDLNDIRSEYEDWQSNLPESLSQSPVADKLQAVVDLDLDPDSLLSEVDGVIGEAEAADLPLGFGRD